MPGMYVVIMAGGGGTRLRPLSTADRPKPFLPLLPTGETLLQRTVRRLEGPELALEPGAIHVVVSPGYAHLVEAQVEGARVVVEPQGRNTAAAIALAALAINRDEDEVMLVLPADHRIEPAREGTFRAVLATAAGRLATGSFGIESPLVTLGVEPSRPATEYGYLLPDTERAQAVDGLEAYPLRAFEEKPTRERAAILCASPGTAWNAGMFLWRRRAIRAALAKHAPEVVSGLAAGLAAGDLAAPYAAIPARSVDYAVMEPAAAAGSVVMAAMDVGWTDIGSWSALLEVLGASGIEGGVVEAGESAETAAGDLVIEDGGAGLAVRAADGGTITPDRPVALLRGARDAHAIVRSLLDRCATAEARA
jgi:mannose-1-phosphate guanylyltransferase